MAYTIVHCSDVHLETTFPELRGGARRRAALADALGRIVDLALERGADALTVGGDLFEAERAGPQTARFFCEQFARFGRDVFVAPGNHDPYAPSSLLAATDLPSNVRVFGEAAWRAVPLADGLTLFGFGHTAAEPGRPFRKARFDRPGVRIALVHGSDEERCPPEQTRDGALHRRGDRVGGRDAAADGPLPRRLRRRGRRRPAGARAIPARPSRSSSANGARTARSSSASRANASRWNRSRSRRRGCSTWTATSTTRRRSPPCWQPSNARSPAAARATTSGCRLTGQPLAGTRVDPHLIDERLGGALGALDVRDETTAYDYETIAREPTVRGRAVADLLALAQAGGARGEEARHALRYCVAAFEGSEIAP